VNSFVIGPAVINTHKRRCGTPKVLASTGCSSASQHLSSAVRLQNLGKNA
jgi:hypothetical protein